MDLVFGLLMGLVCMVMLSIQRAPKYKRRKKKREPLLSYLFGFSGRWMIARLAAIRR